MNTVSWPEAHLAMRDMQAHTDMAMPTDQIDN